MNARTDTTDTPEIAASVQNLIFVPLPQLRAPKRNVCKTGGASITELAVQRKARLPADQTGRLT
jgi:hypothetical protein